MTLCQLQKVLDLHVNEFWIEKYAGNGCSDLFWGTIWATLGEEKFKKCVLRIASVLAEIRTNFPPKIDLKRYFLVKLLGR